MASSTRDAEDDSIEITRDLLAIDDENVADHSAPDGSAVGDPAVDSTATGDPAVDSTATDHTAPGPVSSPLRERKRRATREALQRSAIALVAQRGLAAVTVEDIAAGADVSPRTFFNYFPTKEDALSGWDPGVLAELVEYLRSRPAEEPPALALAMTLREVLSRYDADHRDLLVRMQVTKADPHLIAHHVARWGDTERQLVATLAERRNVAPGRDHYTELVVATTLAAGRVALMSWCDKEGTVSLADELAFHLNVLGKGLTEPEDHTEPEGQHS